MPGQLDVAPMWRRVCAGLVDVVIWVVTVLPLEYLLWSERGAPHGLARAETMFEDTERMTRWAWRLDVLGRVWRVWRVGARNVRSPGRRLLGIRWADAVTGGPVPLRRGVAHELLGGGWRFALHRLLALLEPTSTLLSPHHQSLLERLAGVVVVGDRR